MSFWGRGVIFNRPKPADRFLRDVEREILGRCASIEHREGCPVVHIGPDLNVVVRSQWRLIDGQRILVTDSDDGQWFGLSAPVDAAAKATERLLRETVNSIEFDGITGDLRLHFSNSLVLEILTNSSGYESWVMDLRGEHFAVGASGGLV